MTEQVDPTLVIALGILALIAWGIMQTVIIVRRSAVLWPVTMWLGLGIGLSIVSGLLAIEDIAERSELILHLAELARTLSVVIFLGIAMYLLQRPRWLLRLFGADDATVEAA